MRIRTAPAILALLALLSLLPAASARLPDVPDLNNVDVAVGPCHYARNVWWEGAGTSAECVVEGHEVLAYWDSTTIGGHSCGLRVLGQPLQQCDPGPWE